jgi:hypothetical protein
MFITFPSCSGLMLRIEWRSKSEANSENAIPACCVASTFWIPINVSYIKLVLYIYKIMARLNLFFPILYNKKYLVNGSIRQIANSYNVLYVNETILVVIKYTKKLLNVPGIGTHAHIRCDDK